MTNQLVWFKRDLRCRDHAALLAAIQAGPVACVYIVEPSYWRGEDTSQRQYEFLRESLRDLFRELKKKHQLTLHVVYGEVVEVMDRLHQQLAFQAIHSHQETGNALTFERDRNLAQWCTQHKIAWHEYLQHGVFRRLRSRNTWQSQWESLMHAPIAELPAGQDAVWPWPPEVWPAWSRWERSEQATPLRQQGGRSQGMALLSSFLNTRAAHYRGAISSPLSASSACSRLSAYLSLGCLSMRETVLATQERLDQSPDEQIRKGLRAFLSRLHWHCHFIQKLESEPAIEWFNMHRGYDDLRESEWDAQRFERLQSGTTGWPLVDACVRMLRETGWLNFRMRAMLVSVAAYPLWLHWKPVGDWLASQFTDYEPGIHWSQMQMQSGTTGINTTRVYNPIKQARDQDPEGVFVRRWLPVLRRVPDVWLFEPWKMPANVQQQCGVVVGQDWPEPVVNLEYATREAKARLHQRRAQGPVKAAKAAVLERHGSRQLRNPAAKKTGAASQRANGQLSLDW